MKKKSLWGKKIVFVISVDPYSQECIVVCNGTFKDAEMLFEKNKKTPNATETLKHIKENRKDYPLDFKPNQGCGVLFNELPFGYIMMFNHEASWINTVGIIVHEATHLTHWVLQRAGIKLTKESEEAYTYLTEKTVETILRKIY